MRRLSISLIIYGILLAVLVNFIPAKPFFLLISVFFACGAVTALKGYKGKMENLSKNVNSRLGKEKEARAALLGEVKKADDYISELHGRERAIASLYEITKKMSQALTFDEIFSVLGSFLKENFTFRKSELILLKEEGNIIKVDKIYKAYREEKDADEKGRGEESRVEVLNLFSKNREGVYVPGENGSSLAAVPLLGENKFVGILTIEDLPRHFFDKFSIVAMQFALEIKKVLLYETVEALAITDSLTALYTRRYFFERMEEELNRSKRHGLKFAFLMLDIDNFKVCNDTYGHLVGDVALKEIARVIKESTREIDIAARYGGEEFSIILPETDKTGARLAAERIRRRIEENVVRAYDEKLKITVSIGLAVCPEDAPASADLVEKADKALYAAKASGKNIVCEYRA